MRVFLAGSTGAIGSRLVRLLVERGHEVTAMTHSPEKAGSLRGLGADPVVADGLDGVAVNTAVARALPQVVVHQMTAIGGKPDMRHFDHWFAQTNKLRTQGTQHLLDAARAAGARRFIAQSYTGWPNERTGGPIKDEDDPLDPDPARSQRETLEAIRFLERSVLDAPLAGLVLRYGAFYGPGGSDPLVTAIRKRQLPIVGSGQGVWSWIHIDDAAMATLVAVESGCTGLYNIVDDEPAKVADWLPYLADVVGAKPPRHIPVWLARVLAGSAAVQWMTEGRGSSNRKAKRELGWRPVWTSWRDGFRQALETSAAVPD